LVIWRQGLFIILTDSVFLTSCLEILGVDPLVSTSLLAITSYSGGWSWNVALVMIVCNLVAIVIGRYAIQNRGKGPSLPVSLPAIFDGFGVPELLATTSFGHVLGAGAILGLRASGLL
jgi:photosystem I subunit X